MVLSLQPTSYEVEKTRGTNNDLQFIKHKTKTPIRTDFRSAGLNRIGGHNQPVDSQRSYHREPGDYAATGYGAAGW